MSFWKSAKKMFLKTLWVKEWSVRNWVLNSASGSGINVSPESWLISDYDKKTKKVSRQIIKNKEMTISFWIIYLLFHHITTDQVLIKCI